jgi:hypothetical protein
VCGAAASGYKGILLQVRQRVVKLSPIAAQNPVVYAK